MNSLVSEMIRGRHAFASEDRLSHVFSAIFNTSPIFRKLISKAIFPKEKSIHLRAQVQVMAGDRQKHGRLDIRVVDISRREREVAVIENKIDAVLTGKQLLKYQKAAQKRRRVIAIVRQPPRAVRGLRRFEIYSWADIDQYLADGDWQTTNAADGKIIRSFRAYLGELGMDALPILKRADLGSLKEMVRVSTQPTRFTQRNLARRSCFQTANDLLKIFKYVCDEAAKDDFFVKRFEKKFRFAPWFGNWMPEKEGELEYSDNVIGFYLSNRWDGRSKKIAAVGLVYVISLKYPKSTGFYVYRKYKINKKHRRDWLQKKLPNVFEGQALSPYLLKNAALTLWKRWL